MTSSHFVRIVWWVGILTAFFAHRFTMWADGKENDYNVLKIPATLRKDA